MGKDDYYVIEINLPVPESDLISEIKSLQKTSQKPKYEPQPEEEPFMISSFNKKKDKKKKKKDRLGVDKFIEDIEENGEREDSPELDENLIDLDEIFKEDDDSIDSDIIDEQKRGYDKLKKQENLYKKEFAEELTLLYNLLDEINRFSKDLEKRYKGLESSKVRGTSKYINDLIQNILSSKQSKLAVLREIANIKRGISELKIKDMKAKDGQQEKASSEYLAANYLQQILKYGRSNFVRDFGTVRDDDDIDRMIDKIESHDSDNDGIDSDELMRVIDERLEKVDNPFRSSDGDKYIQYENKGVKVWIRRCIDTGEWDFVAYDKDQQEVEDYPLPSKKDVGKVKFTEDGRMATDSLGRTYKVTNYFSPDNN